MVLDIKENSYFPDEFSKKYLLQNGFTLVGGFYRKYVLLSNIGVGGYMQINQDFDRYVFGLIFVSDIEPHFKNFVTAAAKNWHHWSAPTQPSPSKSSSAASNMLKFPLLKDSALCYEAFGSVVDYSKVPRNLVLAKLYCEEVSDFIAFYKMTSLTSSIYKFKHLTPSNIAKDLDKILRVVKNKPVVKPKTLKLAR